MNTEEKELIQIHKTQRGNDAVLASELHRQLGVKTPLRNWMPRMIEYGFEDSKDFYRLSKNVRSANGMLKQNFDWVLTIHTAKEIAMIQRTPQGKAIRNYLIQLENKVSDGQLLTPEQSAALLDLVSVMGFASVRKYCERMHFDKWEQPSTWWQHRAKILGYSARELKTKCEAIGKRYKNRQQALIHIDPLELIKVAVIDLFIGLGKSETYAQNIGHAAKLFAQKIPPVFDNDLNGGFDFKTQQQKHIISNIQSPALLEKF